MFAPPNRIITLALPAIFATVLTAQNVTQLSLEKESALGSQLAAEIRAQTTAVESPVVQHYIDTLGQKLASAMPHAQHPFTFRVVADDPCPRTHEPAALPGGYIFIPAALLTAAKDEAEFAGALAHAMEHIAQRHGYRQANVASIPLVFVGGWLPGSCFGGVAVPAGLAASQRGAEQDADFWASQAMTAAGFDPAALLRYATNSTSVRPRRRSAASTGASGRLQCHSDGSPPSY